MDCPELEDSRKGRRKLQDILCKSNPWDNKDCKREDCFSCDTATKLEGINFKNCRQRSIIYETWCETCKRREKEKNKSQSEKEKEGKKRKKKDEDDVKVYRYIGETSRSIYERGVEHKKDLEHRRPRSHLLRHCVEEHEEEEADEIEFGMRIVSSHRTAFERQLAEAVMIERYNGPYLLNSKLEYSRCNIPKLQLKLGDTEDKPDPMKEKEKSAKEKIKMKYKQENKREKEDENEERKRNSKRRKKSETEKEKGTKIDDTEAVADEEDFDATEVEVEGALAWLKGQANASSSLLTPTISTEIVGGGGPENRPKNLTQSDYFKGDLFVTKLTIRAPEIAPEKAPETDISKDSNGEIRAHDSNGAINVPFSDLNGSNGKKLIIKSDSNGQ